MASKKVRIQDDLYAHVNQAWIDKAVIPDDKPMAGGFSDLAKGVEDRLIADFKKMAEGKKPCRDKNMKKALALFKLAQDTERRNREGIEPLLYDLQAIDGLENVDALNSHLKDFVLNGLPLPFTCSVDTDMKDTARHAFTLSGPSVILPDTA